MTWLKKDDRYPEHRKIRRLTDGEYRLHDTAMHYAAKDESDGRIMAEDIDEMQHGRRLARHIPALVACGLWEPFDGGWLIHDFLDYNPSHEQLEAERAHNRARQAKLRERRRTGPSSEVGHAVTNGVSNAPVTRESQDPVPYRSVPFRTDPSRSTGSPLSVVDGETSSSSSPSVTRGAANG